MFKDKNNFTDEDKQKIIDLHNDGLLNKEIAEKFDTSVSSIARVLQASGLPSRHPLLTPEREDAAIELYKKYGKLCLVEKELHMNASTIKKILNRNNIHVNSNSEAHQVYKLNEHYFDSIDTNNKAYILGLLCSDGSIHKTYASVALSLQEEDKYILDRINEEIDSNRPLLFRDYKSKKSTYLNQYQLTIVNRYIHDVLVGYGLIPNKSIYGGFPNGIPEEYYSKFFLGIMDGDGTIHRNPKDRRCGFLGTEAFCVEAKNIIERILGIHCSIMYNHGEKGKDRPTRVLQVAGRHQVKKFLDWLYTDADMYLTRKYEIYKDLYL